MKKRNGKGVDAKKMINWLYFVVFCVFVAFDLLLVGIRLEIPRGNYYWTFVDGVVFLLIAMIVSYVPWFDEIKTKIWEASWEHLFIICMLVIGICIIIGISFNI